MKKTFIFKFKQGKLETPEKLNNQIKRVVSRINDNHKVDTISITMMGTDFVDETLHLVVNIKPTEQDCIDALTLQIEKRFNKYGITRL